MSTRLDRCLLGAGIAAAPLPILCSCVAAPTTGTIVFAAVTAGLVLSGLFTPFLCRIPHGLASKLLSSGLILSALSAVSLFGSLLIYIDAPLGKLIVAVNALSLMMTIGLMTSHLAQHSLDADPSTWPTSGPILLDIPDSDWSEGTAST